MKIVTAAALIALAAQANAFAPSSTGRPIHAISPQQQVVEKTQTQTPASRSNTSLNMNMFDRFSRVAKANINNVLKNMEDPEKILNQAVEDMQVSPTIPSLFLRITQATDEYSSLKFIHSKLNFLDSLFLRQNIQMNEYHKTVRSRQGPPILRRSNRHTTPSPQTERTVRCPRRGLVPACSTRAPKGQRRPREGSPHP